MDTIEMIKFFCKNLKSLRINNNLSQAEMAKRLKLSVRTLSTIENGKLPFSVKHDVLLRIYENFGILPSEIFAEDFSHIMT